MLQLKHLLKHLLKPRLRKRAEAAEAQPAEAAAPETAEAAEAQPDVEDKASEGTRQTGLAVAECARNLALRT